MIVATMRYGAALFPCARWYLGPRRAESSRRCLTDVCILGRGSSKTRSQAIRGVTAPTRARAAQLEIERTGRKAGIGVLSQYNFTRTQVWACPERAGVIVVGLDVRIVVGGGAANAERLANRIESTRVGDMHKDLVGRMTPMRGAQATSSARLARACTAGRPRIRSRLGRRTVLRRTLLGSEAEQLWGRLDGESEAAAFELVGISSMTVAVTMDARLPSRFLRLPCA